MENLWPIAFGLAIIGLIWAVVMNAKFNADREKNLRLQALDLAIDENNPRPTYQQIEKAEIYLKFLDGEASEAKSMHITPEAQPYQLHAHEAS